jgi:hypothetical protein
MGLDWTSISAARCNKLKKNDKQGIAVSLLSAHSSIFVHLKVVLHNNYHQSIAGARHRRAILSA